MFDQIASQLTSEPCKSSASTLPEMDNRELLEQITTRLEQEVPEGPYVPDKWLAAALGIAPKTLINRRIDNPERYPKPIHMFDGQTALHPRRELVHWLAREEMRARTRRIHKCF